MANHTTNQGGSVFGSSDRRPQRQAWLLGSDKHQESTQTSGDCSPPVALPWNTVRKLCAKCAWNGSHTLTHTHTHAHTHTHTHTAIVLFTPVGSVNLWQEHFGFKRENLPSQISSWIPSRTCGTRLGFYHWEMLLIHHTTVSCHPFVQKPFLWSVRTGFAATKTWYLKHCVSRVTQNYEPGVWILSIFTVHCDHWEHHTCSAMSLQWSLSCLHQHTQSSGKFQGETHHTSVSTLNPVQFTTTSSRFVVQEHCVLIQVDLTQKFMDPGN